MKKQSIGCYINIITVIVVIAALVTMVLSSNMNQAYVLTNLTIYMIGAVVSIILIGVAIWAPNRFGNHDIISTVAVIAAVAILTFIMGQIIMNRILLISGLFSWNSLNTIGWQVFYMSVASIGCYIISAVLLIIGSFTKSVK